MHMPGSPVLARVVLCFVWSPPLIHAVVSPEQDQAFACGQNALSQGL